MQPPLWRKRRPSCYLRGHETYESVCEPVNIYLSRKQPFATHCHIYQFTIHPPICNLALKSLTISGSKLHVRDYISKPKIAFGGKKK